MLLQRGVVLRADWEAVITPVIDHVSSRPGIDPNRIAFKAADGAGDHCEAAARRVFHDAAFAWLEYILQTER
jgi:hypothetical protein